MRYELIFHMPQKSILHTHRRENLKSYMALTGWALCRIGNVYPVRCELGFHIPQKAFFKVAALETSNLLSS
jgi:hypothetical protein